MSKAPYVTATEALESLNNMFKERKLRLTDDQWIKGFKAWRLSNAINVPGGSSLISMQCSICSYTTMDGSKMFRDLSSSTGYTCRVYCGSTLSSAKNSAPPNIGNKKACTCGGTVRAWNVGKSAYECSTCGKLDSVSPSPWSVALDEALEELTKLYKPELNGNGQYGSENTKVNKFKSCTCGSDKTYGPNSLTHSSWCDLSNG